MSRRKGTRPVELSIDKFSMAKRQYPQAMQRLVLLVKQQKVLKKKLMPKLSDVELKGLCALGVLRLEVGQGGAKMLLVESAVEILRQTQIAELQTYVEQQRQEAANTPPVSRVRQRGSQAFHRRRAV